MNRSIAAAAVAACLLPAGVAPASAQGGVCADLAAVRDQVAAAGIPAAAIKVVIDEGFARAYVAALGHPVPAGSSPVGLLVVQGAARTVVGLVEPARCVRFHVTVPTPRHLDTWRRAQESI